MVVVPTSHPALIPTTIPSESDGSCDTDQYSCDFTADDDIVVPGFYVCSLQTNRDAYVSECLSIEYQGDLLIGENIRRNTELNHSLLCI